VPALMVQGVSSDAGKSLLVTALCRWTHQHGMTVAPFKAQNMSNNARVVDGGEIGTAQWLQAIAAGVHPDVRMNPILLKPESDTSSQVVLNGVVSDEFTTAPWRDRSSRLWPYVTEAFSSLSDEFDVVIIEGAGSPAETNLWSSDIVNMAVAELADAPVALVADIDRGGAFAHLFGTWALLPPPWQQRIEGFVLNKFRGDLDLLAPAPEDLEAATGVPTIGVLPWLDHGLPDEEGPTILVSSGSGPRVSIVCGPYASNLDEFVQLQQVASVDWVRTVDQLADADLIILPGSKHVANDLDWLRDTGLAHAVSNAARDGIAVLGICGGLQMLGQRVEDPARVEGTAEGLALLPMVTRYETSKRTVQSTICFGPLAPPWSWLGERRVSGYEIRHGVTRASEAVEIVPDGLAFGRGNVLGLYLHGVFEDPVVLKAFSGTFPTVIDTTFDRLADAIEKHLDTAWLLRRLEGAVRPVGG
jgi:adenosylcobyric acid synthase